MDDRRFGDAGRRLVIEECLSGPEVSFFVVADGIRAVPIGEAMVAIVLADHYLRHRGQTGKG